jgi:hypothetical protein
MNPSTESGSYERYQGGPGSILEYAGNAFDSEEYVIIINL